MGFFMIIRVTSIVFLASAVLAACFAADAISVDAAKQNSETDATSIKAEIIDTLPTQEVWSFQPPVLLASEGGGVIMYWGYGIEVTPLEEDWIGVGVVMAGLGDLYEKPVAVRIWTKASDRFLKDQSIAESENGDNAVALFGDAEGKVRLRFAVTPYGDVLINEKPIGAVDFE